MMKRSELKPKRIVRINKTLMTRRIPKRTMMTRLSIQSSSRRTLTVLIACLTSYTQRILMVKSYVHFNSMISFGKRWRLKLMSASKATKKTCWQFIELKRTLSSFA